MGSGHRSHLKLMGPNGNHNNERGGFLAVQVWPIVGLAVCGAVNVNFYTTVHAVLTVNSMREINHSLHADKGLIIAHCPVLEMPP